LPQGYPQEQLSESSDFIKTIQTILKKSGLNVEQTSSFIESMFLFYHVFFVTFFSEYSSSAIMANNSHLWSKKGSSKFGVYEFLAFQQIAAFNSMLFS